MIRKKFNFSAALLFCGLLHQGGRNKYAVNPIRNFCGNFYRTTPISKCNFLNLFFIVKSESKPPNFRNIMSKNPKNNQSAWEVTYYLSEKLSPIEIFFRPQEVKALILID